MPIQILRRATLGKAMGPTVALVTDLWPSTDEPHSGAFVRASVVAVGERARVVVLAPRLVGRRAHAAVWNRAIQGWQTGWEQPRSPNRLLRYPMLRVPYVGEAQTRALGARLALLLGRERPGVVHAHFLHEVGVAAVLLARTLGVPSVVSVHGTDARWLFDGGIQDRHRRAMLDAARHADRVLVVNRSMRDAFAERGVDPDRLEILPMGVDETVFHLRDRIASRAQVGIEAAEQVVLFIGRSTPEKGIHVLERALERLDGVTAYAVGAAQPTGPVKALGVLSPDDLAVWMSAADVCCLPSFAEGSPVSVVEALAAGTPVVATTVGAIPDQVGPQAGVLVDPGDDVALADALRGALDRGWDRNAIRISSQPYWWSVLGPRLSGIYEGLVK